MRLARLVRLVRQVRQVRLVRQVRQVPMALALAGAGGGRPGRSATPQGVTAVWPAMSGYLREPGSRQSLASTRLAAGRAPGRWSSPQ